jgi:hypothetical protein
MTKANAMSWRRVGCWIVWLVLVLAIAFEVEIWLDVLVFQPEEYGRLIGSESACGIAKSYCSWRAFILDNAPLAALSILSAFALLWRRLPRRELVLLVLVMTVLAYFAWRAYRTQAEISAMGHCCQYQEPGAGAGKGRRAGRLWLARFSESSQEIG